MYNKRRVTRKRKIRRGKRGKEKFVVGREWERKGEEKHEKEK